MTKASDNKVHTPAGDLTKKEVETAKKEGVTEAIKDGAKASMVADTGTTGDAEEAAERARLRVAPDLNTTFLATFLDLDVEVLTKRLSAKPDDPEMIDFEAAKGLLALERAAQNRTDYVKALMKAIGAKSPYDVTPAGPPYTNDVQSVSKL
jgi:hypothetical protein